VYRISSEEEKCLDEEKKGIEWKSMCGFHKRRNQRKALLRASDVEIWSKTGLVSVETITTEKMRKRRGWLKRNKIIGSDTDDNYESLFVNYIPSSLTVLRQVTMLPLLIVHEPSI